MKLVFGLGGFGLHRTVVLVIVYSSSVYRIPVAVLLSTGLLMTVGDRRSFGSPSTMALTHRVTIAAIPIVLSNKLHYHGVLRVSHDGQEYSL